MSDESSRALLERASRVMPGGVSSPVRAFRAVGGAPIFVREASGPHVVGANGQQYIDFVGSWGPMILGHADPEVVQVIARTAALGSSYGAPTEGEITLCETLVEACPSMDMVRLVSSGTEAVMGALRAARGFTGRDLVVKMVGGYHGGADYLLVKAGSGLATFGEPDSAGVPADLARCTLLLPYNDLEAAQALFRQRGSEIAAVILEPVAGNMGCVPTRPGYLAGLRALTSEHGAMLVFDEVMTGFRVAYGGEQARSGVRPDLTTLGKIVGGGLPVGAYGGRREIMEKIAPLGPVYQAGTLSGNPLAVQAGLVTLRALRRPGAYENLEAAGEGLQAAFERSAAAHGVPLTVQRVGSMLTPFFRSEPVHDWDGAAACDTECFGRFHAALVERGVLWPPSQFEAGFVSLSHDPAVLERAAQAIDGAMSTLA